MKKIKSLLSILLVAMCVAVLPVTTFADEITSPLTPEGNLTLVDDVTVSDEIDKQFITAVTKNGNYFYIVIDRSDNKENVYLLNMVDEADLMALANGEQVPVEPSENTETLTPEIETESEDTELNEPTEEQTETQNPMLFILVIVIIVGGVGGACYFYFDKKSKNKAKMTLDDDDYDYDRETEVD